MLSIAFHVLTAHSNSLQREMKKEETRRLTMGQFFDRGVEGRKPRR
ncbi:hypothetical protein LINPERHAP2_LOCUS32018 [Linum perenne]